MNTQVDDDDNAALQIAREWMEAAARCDLQAIEAGMAAGCRRFGEPDWMVLGKAEYLEGYRQFLLSFSDYRLEILNVMAQGDTVVFEMTESATFTGPFPLPDGRVIEPNGQSYIDRVCTWVVVDDHGLVSEIRAYIPSNRGRLLAQATSTQAARSRWQRGEGQSEARQIMSRVHQGFIRSPNKNNIPAHVSSGPCHICGDCIDCKHG